MYTDIKTFEDACKVFNLDPTTIIPDFSLFPESDRQAMIDHAKLVIIAKAINGDWIPDWNNGKWDKYYPWFVMGSSSGVGFSYFGYDDWDATSFVGSRLCFESGEKARYAGTQFKELYKSYFVKG
jgi:hypothetical protein